MRSYEEKFKALSLSNGLPVAVLNLPILGLQIGTYERIQQYDAYRLRSIIHPILKDYFDINSHIWVNPREERYADAWEVAGLYKTPGSHLDHLHSKAVAIAQGYEYVLLYSCSPGANMSAANEEKNRKNIADSTYALKHRVLTADELHWRKMWGLKKDLINE